MTKLMRTGDKFRSLVNFIRAKYVSEGKKPPRTSAITDIIAGKIDKQEVLRDVENIFIRF